jgi:16S rRNA processing protein RimM
VSDKVERIAIGRFGRTRGVHGEIYVIPYGEYPERILDVEQVEIELTEGFVEAQLTKRETISEKIVVKVDGYDTPEISRTLTNRDIFIPRDRLDRLPEGEHYAFELEGCAVESSDGKTIGELKKVESYPVSDLYVIQTIDGKRFRLPAVKKFVLQIDTEKRKIVIAPPDGLLDAQ